MVRGRDFGDDDRGLAALIALGVITGGCFLYAAAIHAPERTAPWNAALWGVPLVVFPLMHLLVVENAYFLMKRTTENIGGD